MKDKTRERLLGMARQEEALYAASQERIDLNLDVIRAEIARLTGELYRRVGMGEDVAGLCGEYVVKARATAAEYNRRQIEIYGRRYAAAWRQGLVGYYGEDEAEVKIRYAGAIVALLMREDGDVTQG